MNKRLRGEPERFFPRLKWWLRGEYRYWDYVAVIERELGKGMWERALANETGGKGPTVTDIAHRIAMALWHRP